jgi:hypothetical protein
MDIPAKRNSFHFIVKCKLLEDSKPWRTTYTSKSSFVVSYIFTMDKLIHQPNFANCNQEAVVVGAEAATRRDDHVITAYRNHAHYLGRGGTPFEALCELMGKAPGT